MDIQGNNSAMTISDLDCNLGWIATSAGLQPRLDCNLGWIANPESKSR